MDIRKVKKLIELLEESGIAEIEIREGEESVRISRGVSGAVYAPAPAYAPPPAAPAPAAAAQPAAAEKGEAPGAPEGAVVESPMVGTFYTAPSPESPPFVTVGQAVKPGDTLCIIEAMKIMNPIEAEIGGKVSAILADNGHPVEYGQPLFIIT
ncbi:MAG: acetyl-CoA carboxylase biotin carboxyl carrier protein [Gammaproteobacteria bacterium]|nr:acetyl-CoA carboxylase biotin carboxyl carrier protein [Gammaproteobacteria bacterium]MCP5200583.1 acetyl-CoA carboxylase biotin carboxyl carrier protein [Gammaproteobacteria bacterium]